MKRCAILVALAVLFAGWPTPRAGVAQSLPPGPTTVAQAKLALTVPAGEYELVSLVLDWAPGALAPSHTHGAQVLGTVLAGEMSDTVEGHAEQLFKAGQSWIEQPGEYAVISNKASTTARVAAVTLLPKGAALTTAKGGPPTANPPPGPKTITQDRLPLTVPAGEYELVSLVLDWAAGAAAPLHTHGAQVLGTVVQGEMSDVVEGQPEQIIKTGQSWVEQPGEYAVISNKGSTPARVSAVVLLPKGAPLTTLKNQPAVLPTGSAAPVGMPSTGRSDPTSGLVPALGISLLCLTLGLIYWRRQRTQR